MATKPDHQQDPFLIETPVPSVERIQRELASAKSSGDFFGKEGIFARLFAGTLEHMLEAELTAQLGYEPYAAQGRNSGNSRNGKRSRNLRTSAGDMTIQVPRDRTSEFQPVLLEKYQTSTNELEEKIIALYAKGVSTRDIQQNLEELYGVEVSAQTISTITEKVWSLVEPSVLVSNETDHHESLVYRGRGDHHDQSVLTHQQWLCSTRLGHALIGDPA